MKIGKFLGHNLRHPRTTQEKRANGRRGKWNRAKRNSANLADAWDDIWIHNDKSWKSKRKTQYMGRKDLKKYSLYLPSGDSHLYGYKDTAWHFEDYLKEHKISYKIEEIKATKRFYNSYYNRHYYMLWVIGTNFTWWHHTDIGLEYILG